MYRLDENAKNFTEEFLNFLAFARDDAQDVSASVREIIQNVRENGDAALLEYTQKFDHFEPQDLKFSKEEISAAKEKISDEERDALLLAAERIESYHQRQLPKDEDFTDAQGARMGWHWSPIRSVGIYVPGGLASYPSSVLMNAIPAKVAGVSSINMCVPCPDGEVNPLVLFAASLSGVKNIYKIGGAQAIAALAYGTASVPHVDMVSGPGNAFVAEAKRQVFGHIGIDMIAGPSEVLIIADQDNNPDWVAMDVLSQAEHDERARAILITDNADFAKRVEDAIEKILTNLSRADIARKSWQEQGAIIIAKSLQSAAHLSNLIAPEHLQICTKEARALSHLTTEAGAIFLGAWSPEAIGDYVSGPNHVLPTSRAARFSSGLSVLNFMKRTSVQEITPKALSSIGPATFTLANSEGLEAHGLSVKLRLDALNEKNNG